MLFRSIASPGNANQWHLTGNAATTPGVNFLGTTDHQPLELKVNRQRVLRLEPGGPSAQLGDGVPTGAPNLVGGAAVNSVASGVVGAVIAGGGVACGARMACVPVHASAFKWRLGLRIRSRQQRVPTPRQLNHTNRPDRPAPTQHPAGMAFTVRTTAYPRD